MSSIFKWFAFKPAHSFVIQMSRLGISFFVRFWTARPSATDGITNFMFSFLWTVIWCWRSSMTVFVNLILCLILFQTVFDWSGIRTLARFHVPQFLGEEFLEFGAFDCRAVLVDRFAFKLRDFIFITFSIQRFILLPSMRHPIRTIWLNGFPFKPTLILVTGELSTEKFASPRLKLFLTGVRFEPSHTLVFQKSRLR